ncbi:MAG: hypothetical protein ACOCP4_03525, partial [Candidatus Woesearchaeota archaeon]
MEFQNKNEKSLKVDDHLLNENFRVLIKNKRDSFYDLVDVDNLRARIHESIIWANRKDLEDHEEEIEESEEKEN